MALLSNSIPDAALTLRPSSAGPVTSSTTETPMAAPFPLGHIREAVAMIGVRAMGNSNGDESYLFAIQASASVGGSYITIAQLARHRDSGPGVFVIPLSSDDARILGLPNTVFIRIVATLAGTSPSVNYAAWITQSSPGSTTTLE
jgi:hypothetical protein